MVNTAQFATLDFSNEILCMAQDFVCGERLIFDDGTQQIIREIDGEQCEQSPRMEEDDLTAFCSAHFSKYQDHYDQYLDSIIEGDLHEVPLLGRFWEHS
ncbi:hypothetical protein [Vibrio sp. R78045]|uniref:hypothetical protein n=1 Tax=Vibrio sp. R78045 TaxID=3093868 RepID=UPI0036F3E20A